MCCWLCGGVFTRGGKSACACVLPPCCLLSKGTCIEFPAHGAGTVCDVYMLLTQGIGCWGVAYDDKSLRCCVTPYDKTPKQVRMTCLYGGSTCDAAGCDECNVCGLHLRSRVRQHTRTHTQTPEGDTYVHMGTGLAK